MSNSEILSTTEIVERSQAIENTRNKVTIHEMLNFDKGSDTPVKVSIVMPICNVEPYLRDCIDSCINQTLEEIEIICVNDGSTDNCAEILREYAAKDERVKVINKDNAGYGHTMNLGMDLARGEYIGIVESDDFVKLDMFETLYNKAKELDIDIIKADFYRFTTHEGYMRLYYNFLSNDEQMYNRVIDGAEATSNMFKFTNTWAGIYKRSFLESYSIRHQETPGASYQDNGFWFQTTCSASRIYYLNRPFYMNRRDNPNSSVYKKDKVYMGNKEYEFIHNYLLNNPELYDEYKYIYTLKRFDNYYFNYRRIAAEFKKDYIFSISEEFAKAFEDGEVDESLFSSSNYKKLREIVENPGEFYERTYDIEDISYVSQIKKGDIPIVMLCDDGYIIPTITAITSMIKFKDASSKYDITIIVKGVSDYNIRKLARLSRKNVEINIVYLDETNEYENNEVEAVTNYGVPTTALAKFYIPEIMSHCDKLIYLDGDIIVKRDLSVLYNYGLGEAYAGVVRDMPQVLYEKQIFGKKYGRGYFNSGVMLLNAKKMRKDNITQKLIETKKTIESKLQDQDVFNEVFGEDIRQLPIKYNTLYVNLIRSQGKYDIAKINEYYKTKYTDVESIRRDSCVIHYCSSDKPWKFFDVPMADAWIEHFMRANYDMKLRRISVLDKAKAVETNGKFDTVSYEDELKAVVLYFDGNNYDEITENISRIENYSDYEHKIDVIILHNNKLSEESPFTSEKVTVNIINISNLLARDTHYINSGELFEGYYRLAIPEILAEYDKVISIDGLLTENEDLDAYFANVDDSVASFEYTEDGTINFFNSQIVVYNVRRFITGITKFKFIDEYNRYNCDIGVMQKCIAKAFPIESIYPLIRNSANDINYNIRILLKMVSAMSRANYQQSNATNSLIKEFGNAISSSVKNGSSALASSSEVKKLKDDIKKRNDEITKLKNEVAKLKKENEKLKADNKNLNYSLNEIWKSWSYKLGRFFTFIPRKIKSLFKK